MKDGVKISLDQIYQLLENMDKRNNEIVTELAVINKRLEIVEKNHEALAKVATLESENRMLKERLLKVEQRADGAHEKISIRDRGIVAAFISAGMMAGFAWMLHVNI